ncbi:MAG TPA: response regulator [Nitrospiraceae bacterium]|nr:response regulator [Nitrospiraceae bacterium]
MSTLLVIDDDRLNCDMLEAVLSRQGYRIVTATSGREGLELFHQHSPNVTLLDLRMPGMDGLAVLKEIRAHDPAAGVIILGGGATEDQENQARELRVPDFFRKGLSLDMLIGVINQVAQQGQRRKPKTTTSPPSTAAQNERVLIVDDDALVRDLLTRFLELRGYHVRHAKNGAEALSQITDFKPDAILLDLVMPGMSGIDVLRSLREKEYAGGVIILSGNHNETLLKEAWAMGPQEALGKPVDLERLLTAVQLVMVCREC